MPELVTDLRLESATLWMKRLSVRGKNDRARELGYHLQAMADQIYESNPKRYALAYADYQLWHGQVIMYSYISSEALRVYQRGSDVIEQHYAIEAREVQRRQANLDEFAAWRLCLVLGRLYNNQGYTHWMYDGKFTLAVREFQRAINLFRDANLLEELANSSDNMGRVYVALGQEFRAIELIRSGLGLRHKMDLIYREALSNTSLALALSRFDRMSQAEQAADDALRKYRMAGVERGIGLGLLSRGEVYRLIADNWREAGLSDADAARYAERAETDLREALRIFTSQVKEPIREVQARNAMGCFYRTRLLLLEHSDKPTPQNTKDLVFNQGRINFQEAIKVAHANGYLLEELDSVQDLAVLYFRAKRYADAEARQAEMLQRIPGPYKLQPGNDRLSEVGEVERIDAFYRLMGQVEQLFGAIAFDHGLVPDSKVYPRARLTTGPDQVEAMLHYLLGVMYFNRFSKESFVHRQVYARIHKRFQECAPDTVHEIRDGVPRWIEQYGLPEGLVTDLLQDVFGLFDF
jgi:tetratricopeptide (TPR) repeat protein